MITGTNETPDANNTNKTLNEGSGLTGPLATTTLESKDLIFARNATEEVIKSTVTTTQSAEMIRTTFSKTDFTDQPEWGVTAENLTGGVGNEYRKDGRRTNTARVLEVLKKSEVPVDRRLAIAAAVSQLPGSQYAHFLRELEINPKTGEIRAVYNLNPFTGNGTYEHHFSAEDINQFHIPTLTGHTDPTAYEEAMARNPQETLAQLVSEAGQDSNIAFGSWYISKGFLPRYVGLAAIVRNGVSLAQFPIEKMDLTQGESETLKITESLTDIAQQVKELGDRMLSLTSKVRETNKTEIGRRIVELVKLARGKLTSEQVRVVWIALNDFEYKIDRLKEKGGKTILQGRDKNNKLTEIPKQLIDERDELKETGNALIVEAKMILEKAKAEGYSVLA